MVLAYDEQTGEQAFKPVVQLFRNTTDEWYHIVANGEEIVCTAEHPFYVVGLGFVPAKNLSITEYGVTTVSGSLATTLGKDNPFRFKGYYFDEESSMYYCQSRYYVPEWGRWLNSDNIAFLDTSDLNGMNLFCYCGNNPISNLDKNGRSFFAFLATVAISYAISMLVEVIIDAADNGKVDNGWKYYRAKLASNAINALAVIPPLTLITSPIAQIVEAKMLEEEITTEDIIKQTLIDFALDCVSYGVSNGSKALTAHKKYTSIVGKAKDNLTVNHKLADAGFNTLKIGKLGVDGVKEGIMDSCFFTKYMDDIIGSLISFCFGFID